ncbi:inhibitor of growth protein 3 [Chrysoperla carnea]|uniref:inhibitor of growth protein 3 n=1 Tax=Chrysoperla carnea TaxID=189513 RepID=UPI001D081A14|nr:inhibitor of growth protein 3 [Chrysoperla carnea]
MLYLEDYLEIIEHLPQELRDRFTEMREMDLSVQNNIDSLEKRQNQLFNECRRSIQTTGEKPPMADIEFKNLMKDYYRTLEDADEKVHLANHMYDFVERYLRRLDTELYKFKCELEADHSGITQLLEKRSLELDAPQSSQHSQSSGGGGGGSSQVQKENRYRPRSEKRRDSSASNSHEKRLASSGSGTTASSLNSTSASVLSSALTAQVPEVRGHVIASGAINNSGAPQTASAVPASLQPSATQTSGVSYSLGNIGAGNAIAAAASQAIAATQQMQQGRRTASLKASYEAINTGVHGHELSIGRELAGAAHTALQAIQHDHANTKRQKKSVNRKWTSSNSNSSNSSSSVNQIAASVAQVTAASSPAPDTPPTSENVAAGDAVVDDADWTYDPNEPRYCICNQVSYGDMVACDNEDCPFEWFHYNCVNITAPPKGKWYCPQCTSAMRRRGSRKN